MTAPDSRARHPSRTLEWIVGACFIGAAILYTIAYVLGGTISRASWLILAAAFLAWAASVVTPTRPTAHRNLIVVAGLLSVAGLADVLMKLVRHGGL